jgi:hypothetical protein
MNQKVKQQRFMKYSIYGFYTPKILSPLGKDPDPTKKVLI